MAYNRQDHNRNGAPAGRDDMQGYGRSDYANRPSARRSATPRTAPSREARDGASYSRSNVDGRYGAGKKKGVTRRTVLIGAGCAAGAALIGTAAWAVSTVLSAGSRLNENVTEETRAVLQDQQTAAQDLVSNWTDTTPFYMLLLGVDSDASRLNDASDEYGSDPRNYRSDTMILARIDPGMKKVCLISIHRDTWIEIDGRSQKINNAYSIGGAAKTIQVVSDFAGVPISHYAEVNIDALNAVTDALGGVEVNVPYPIDDEEYMWYANGGHLDAGYQTLNGEQAELFCRSRHSYDEMGDGDRYRAANQRLFVFACLDKLMRSSPIDMVNVINVVSNYVATDLTLDQVVNLALAMRGIDTDNDVYSTMNPTDAIYENATWYEINDDERWQEIMWAVDAGEKPPVDSDYIAAVDDFNSPTHGQEVEPSRIAIRTCGGTSQRAANILGQLTAAGYNAWDAGAADLYLERTVVVYEDPLRAADANAIAQLIGASVEPTGMTWTVTAGADIMIAVGVA